MRFKLRTLFLVVLVAAITTPFAWRAYRYYFPERYFREPTVGLCGTGGIDAITHTHITNLLDANGIHSATWGSVIYGTEVEESKLEESIKLLEQSASDGIPTIALRRNEKGAIWISGDKSQAFNIELNKHIDEFAQNANSEHERIVLAIRKHALDSYLANDRLPNVVRLFGSKRKYMDANGVLQDAYDVEIELVDDLDNPNATFTEGYQILNNCRTVSSMGGHGSGNLPDMP